MSTRMLLGLIVFVLSAVRAGSAFADSRNYVWTYEYQTMPAGRAELEAYETLKQADRHDTSVKTLEHWLEFEYGVTDRFDLALYQMWKTRDKRAEYDTKYDGTKIRGRYRFAEKGENILDTLLYAEYKRPAKSHDPHALELKVILAKDIGRCSFSYNQVLNQALESDGATESEFAAGARIAVNNRLSLAAEAKGSYLSDKYYCGPTAAYRGNRFWAAIGMLFAVSARADDVQARVILGIPL